jgi:glycine cleavage system H lipoate-binding protein/TusA-related sulfurtransferase
MEIAGCAVPDDRLYDLEHEVWWKPEAGRGTALLGVMATFASFAGPFRELVFRPVEGTVGRGRSVATVESFRLTGAVRLPLDAEIVERNPEVARRPRLLNDDPYSGGWIVRVRPTRPVEATDPLEPLEAIAARLEERIRDRRIRCWPRTPEVELSEIGLECSAVLVKLNEEVARRGAGEAVLLVTDDPTSPIEMVRWSDQTGHPVIAHRREGDLHQFLVQKAASPVPRRPRP